MVGVKEAIGIVESKNPKNKVIGVSETEDMYILVLDNDNEGYETVNKNTGENSFIWVWEYMELSKAGKTKNLKMESLN